MTEQVRNEWERTHRLMSDANKSLYRSKVEHLQKECKNLSSQKDELMKKLNCSVKDNKKM